MPSGFGLAATSAAALAGNGNNVYQYLPAGPKAWVVPLSCAPVNAPAVERADRRERERGRRRRRGRRHRLLRRPAHDRAERRPVAGLQGRSRPGASTSTSTRATAIEDNGALPRIKNPDLNLAINGPTPAGDDHARRPVRPDGSGRRSTTGARLLGSVLGNAASGGPDFAADEPAGTTKPLKIALEATNTLGIANTAVFTVNWKVPAARVASTQILSGNPLVSASDGHPIELQVVLRDDVERLLVSACTTGVLRAAGGHVLLLAHGDLRERLLDARLRRGDHVGLPFTVTSFVPALHGERRHDRPDHGVHVPDAPDPEQLAARLGITANYQYYLCAAPCSDNDSGYVALRAAGPAGGTATIPVPATPGSWALRIKANNSGPNTPARWPDPITTPAGFPITVSNAPPPIVVTVGASPNPANPGDTVTLTCSATGGTGTYTGYSWTTTSGEFSTQQNFSFRASNSTSAPVILPATCTVTDSAGGHGLNSVNVQSTRARRL